MGFSGFVPGGNRRTPPPLVQILEQQNSFTVSNDTLLFSHGNRFLEANPFTREGGRKREERTRRRGCAELHRLLGQRGRGQGRWDERPPPGRPGGKLGAEGKRRRPCRHAQPAGDACVRDRRARRERSCVQSAGACTRGRAQMVTKTLRRFVRGPPCTTLAGGRPRGGQLPGIAISCVRDASAHAGKLARQPPCPFSAQKVRPHPF